jgi:hypothetical protein
VSGRRNRLEGPIQAEIEAGIGSEPDFLLLRNTVGEVRYFDEKTGNSRFIKYGLGKGSPDLVGILRGRWVCFEVKAAESDLSDDQIRVHAIWERFGALIFVVRSVGEARAALAEARRIIG